MNMHSRNAILTPRELIRAARCPASLKPAEFGLWTIRKTDRTGDEILTKIIGHPIQTFLYKHTAGTLLHPHGEIVMEDSDRELARHLPILMAARGRVLITGLGLGCVVRALLAKPEVQSIDVIELDAGIIERIAPEFTPDPRIKLHHGDALSWPIEPGARWDFAWHDIHVDDHGLQPLHSELMLRFRDHCEWQGAWAFPRSFKRSFARYIPLLGGKRRHRKRDGKK